MTTSSADKGYDADADQLLKTSPVPALHKLGVEETPEAVILRGTVFSYYLKQLAQETVLPVLGDRAIINRIEVVRGPQARQSPGEAKAASPQQATLSERVRLVLLHPTGGVVGLVDDLLRIGVGQGLQLDWHADSCRVRSFDGEWRELTDVPLRKSVFRAMLARVATLCNERTSGSVSPFGGHGELAVGTNPAAVLRVAFVNTPTTQQLELTTAT